MQLFKRTESIIPLKDVNRIVQNNFVFNIQNLDGILNAHQIMNGKQMMVYLCNNILLSNRRR